MKAYIGLFEDENNLKHWKWKDQSSCTNMTQLQPDTKDVIRCIDLWSEHELSDHFGNEHCAEMDIQGKINDINVKYRIHGIVLQFVMNQIISNLKLMIKIYHHISH